MLQRVGTTYLPVSDPKKASEWYQEKLGAIENYRDGDKAILEFANQSFFLVKAKDGERAVFLNHHGDEHFMMTFEVDGLAELTRLHTDLNEQGVKVGAIEERGHAGNNFVFYDSDGNPFDVWSELSPIYKEKYALK